MGWMYSHLSAEERGSIMAMKAQCISSRRIAQVLRRSPSTIVRELERNGHREPPNIPSMGRPRLAYDAT